MAYVYKEQATTGASDAFSKIITEMVNAGWVLYDDVSAENKVYSSVGETGTEITGYMNVYVSSANIYFFAYLYWDNVAHTGTCAPHQGYNNVTFGADQILYTAGSRDLFFVRCSLGTSYSSFQYFGHIPTPYNTRIHTTFTAAATAGDGAILTVADSSDLIIESKYQIVGLSEGRDAVTISSITDGTHVVVHNLPNDYDTGASIGIIPSLFGNSYSTWSSFQPACPITASGLAVDTNYWILGLYIATADLDPSVRTDRHILQPISVYGVGSMIGFCGTNILYAPSGTQDDLFGVKGGHPVNGDVGSSTDTTLTDSNKSWVVNEHASRYVVITAGLGLGQVRNIASNTATALTISNAWSTNPDATSDYSVVDEVYVKLDPWALVFKVIAPLH